MSREEENWAGRDPVGAPVYVHGEDNWSHFDNSVNAVYFGCVATAILVFMFLVMAIFERFLRPDSSPVSLSGGRNRSSNAGVSLSDAKVDFSSHKVAMAAKEVSVLMPGNNVPTFIANPAPMRSLSSSSDRALAFTRADTQLNNTNV